MKSSSFEVKSTLVQNSTVQTSRRNAMRGAGYIVKRNTQTAS
jgi:hypothetical protein